MFAVKITHATKLHYFLTFGMLKVAISWKRSNMKMCELCIFSLIDLISVLEISVYESRWTCQPPLVSFHAFPSPSSCIARLKGLRQVLHQGKPRRNWLLCQDCGHRGGRGRAANCRLHQLLCSSHPKLKTKTWAGGQTHKTWAACMTRPTHTYCLPTLPQTRKPQGRVPFIAGGILTQFQTTAI